MTCIGKVTSESAEGLLTHFARADHSEGRKLSRAVQQLECRVCNCKTGVGKSGVEQSNSGREDR